MLSDHGYVIIPFAKIVKEMLHPMLVCLGYDHNKAWRLVTLEKDTVVPGLGVSVRHMLQTLATEWGRSCIHTNVWLQCWERRIAHTDHVVVDDVRFPNEADLVTRLGGEMWRIERPGVVANTSHASEGGLDSYTFQRRIANQGTLDDLRRNVEAALGA
jgi:hypothetical protein